MTGNPGLRIGRRCAWRCAWWGVALVLSCLVFPPGIAFSADFDTGRLEREIARLAALSGGTMGVAAVHLESGASAFLNPKEPFPLASSYKVPIAVELLHRVDEGVLRLDKMISLKKGDLHPGSGMISSLLDDPGLAISVRNLLELMLLISDNSATDLCLREAGGGEAVTARMRALGIDGIRVDRPTVRLIGDYMGDTAPIPAGKGGRDFFNKRYDAISESEQKAAGRAFARDPRDTATPAATAALLEKIWKGEALSKDSTALLIDIMERCETGEARLKGLLPEGTVVAHKTGTIGGTTNDIGVITLPGGAGHVIVVAFVKDSALAVPARERAIAEVARTIYDFFLFAVE